MKNKKYRVSLALAPFLTLAIVLSYSWIWLRATTSSNNSSSVEKAISGIAPNVSASLANNADFITSVRRVGGRSVEGFAASTSPAIPANLLPEEREALLAKASRDDSNGSAAFNPFFPSKYSDPFVIESGDIKVTCQPLGAESASAQIENGKVVYEGAYRQTDSLHSIAPGRSEEFLLLHSPDAPTRFEYEISAGAGDTQVSLDKGGIRFKKGRGQQLLIEPPWVVDASGRRCEGAARWDLSPEQADGSYRLALLLEPAGLSYPLVIDPSFVLTGRMITARAEHTATLLNDGRVLVVGGRDTFGGALINTAELYDRVKGQWTPAGIMNTPRRSHTATLLTNGKVLVAGGFIAGGASVRIAELYNPVDNSWTNTANEMTLVRQAHTATLLRNGKVLLIGGQEFGLTPSIDLYDPILDKWELKKRMKSPRASHTATLLQDGKILVVGGFSGALSRHASAELYDPDADLWMDVGSLKAGRTRHTATLLSDGQVLVAGGDVDTGFALITELYNPVSKLWSRQGDLAKRISSHTATLLPNGKVLIAGSDGADPPVDVSQLYDPALKAWKSLSPTVMNEPRRLHTATLLPGGEILIAGGLPTDAFDSELFDSTTDTWKSTTPMSVARESHTATLLPNGKVLIVSGFGAGNVSELYDPLTKTMETTADQINIPRSAHTATLMPNGKVLVTGGFTGSGPTKKTELYDPATDTWRFTASELAVGRINNRATLLSNGEVLVTGGLTSVSPGRTATAEVYNPATEIWRSAGIMTVERELHTATLLPDGRVLVTGGVAISGVTKFVDIYNPGAGTGTWSRVGELATIRASHTATLLPNGKVLVTGGTSGVLSLDSSELLNQAGASTPASPLNTSRDSHTATLLPNGKVLVAGGFGTGNVGHLNKSELYDPATGEWSTFTTNLKNGRYNHTATLLPNGNVFVAGGTTDSGTTDTTELFDVGLGAIPGPRPALTSATSPLALNTRFSAGGTSFTGFSEASGSGTNSSPSNYPVVQLLSLSNEQERFLPLDPASNWSATAFTSKEVAGFPQGYALATVFTNGIPSDSRVILVLGETFSVNVPIGTDVTVKTGLVTMTFGNVLTERSVRVTPIAADSAGPTPPGFSINNSYAFDITATPPFTGSITICFNVPTVNDPSEFDMLRVLHGENGMLVDQTLSRDFATRTICAQVTSLSPFIIARLGNRAPVAMCKNVVIAAGSSCVAAISPGDVNNGSFDPDGDSITLALNPPGPLSVGSHVVNLTVTDSHGVSSFCSATVTVTFNGCLRDESNGNVIQFNSSTGDYQFIRCGPNGFTLSGRGTVTVRGCSIRLQDNSTDRRVSATLDTCSKSGTASVQLLPQGTTFTILDRNTTNNDCFCQ